MLGGLTMEPTTLTSTLTKTNKNKDRFIHHVRHTEGRTTSKKYNFGTNAESRHHPWNKKLREQNQSQQQDAQSNTTMVTRLQLQLQLKITTYLLHKCTRQTRDDEFDVK